MIKYDSMIRTHDAGDLSTHNTTHGRSPRSMTPARQRREERLVEIIRLRRQGWTYAAIGLALGGLHRTQVGYILRTHAPTLAGVGIVLRRQKHPEAPRRSVDFNAYARWRYHHLLTPDRVEHGRRLERGTWRPSTRRHPSAPHPGLDAKAYQRWYYLHVKRRRHKRV